VGGNRSTADAADGLFRVTRQPIYVSFALTLWTVPTWTPDQLVIAVVLTAYCLFAPLFKEARYRRIMARRSTPTPGAFRTGCPVGAPFHQSSGEPSLKIKEMLRRAASPKLASGQRRLCAGWNRVDQVCGADPGGRSGIPGRLFLRPAGGKVTLSVFTRGPGATRRRCSASPTVRRRHRAGGVCRAGQYRSRRWCAVGIAGAVVSQPAGGRWLGLAGRSDDGGRTFSGRVVDAEGCSVFTLKRTGPAIVLRRGNISECRVRMLPKSANCWLNRMMLGRFR